MCIQVTVNNEQKNWKYQQVQIQYCKNISHLPLPREDMGIKRFQQENIFPFPLVNPVSEIPVEWHTIAIVPLMYELWMDTWNWDNLIVEWLDC